jgi:hypothetical protein
LSGRAACANCIATLSRHANPTLIARVALRVCWAMRGAFGGFMMGRMSMKSYADFALCIAFYLETF